MDEVEKALDYWEERALRNAEKTEKYANSQARLVTRWFKRAASEMNARILEFYKKYAESEKVSLHKAKQLLSDPRILATTMDEYKRLLAQSQHMPEAARRLAELALSRQIAREEFLKLQLELIQQSLFAEYEALTTETLAQTFEQTYYSENYEFQRYTGLGGVVTRLPINQIVAAVTTSWSGKSYSERIWTNRQSLARRVNRIITTGIISGRPQREMARELEREMDTSAYNARRLIRTEMSYVTGQAAMNSYLENGTEQYKFLATLDLLTSEVCRDLDGKIFDVTEAKVGVNFNPMHPHCRSRTVPYWPDEELDSENTRAARDEEGNTYRVPADMDYAEWHKKYVEGQPEPEFREKALRNIGRDLQQWESYKARLGRGCPKTLEDFQRLKYQNPDGWNDLKTTFRKGLKTVLIHEKPQDWVEWPINREYIESPEYKAKFKGLTKNPFVDKGVYQAAMTTLMENDGKSAETIILLDSKLGRRKETYHPGDFGGQISIPRGKPKSMILVHNHPNSTSFSFTDIRSLNVAAEVDTIFAVGHDGKVYFMSIGKGVRLDLNNNLVYNDVMNEWSRAASANGQSFHKAAEIISERYNWRYGVR